MNQNNRSYNRIRIFSIPLQVSFIKDNVLTSYAGKTIDMSGSGIHFSLKESVLEKEVQLKFYLSGEQFNLRAIIKRKQWGVSSAWAYGCEFVDMTRDEKVHLQTCLFRHDIVN